MSLGRFLWKSELASEIAGEIGEEGVRRALKDPHSRRKPRPCGLTVHSGKGCPNACLYCYVADMYGVGDPIPLGLSGKELVYALLSNPYFVPGKWGTFLAMGAVCDPFHPALVGKTLDIMRSVAEYLGNPIQFSTKMGLGPELVEQIPREASISPLVTIVTLKEAKKLEPNAPPVEERLETIRELRRRGFKPMLFLRPLLPGIVEDELDDLIEEAKKAGAVGVVVGSLRVSKGILERLKKAGYDVKPILSRVGKVGDSLVSVPSEDLKDMALRIIEEKGLVGFKSACCANAFCAGVPCINLCWEGSFCTRCPNDCPSKLPSVDGEEVEEFVREAFGVEVGVFFDGKTIEVRPKGRVSERSRRVMEAVLRVCFRRRVRFRAS